MADIIDEVNLDFQNGQTILRGKRFSRFLARAINLRDENNQLRAGTQCPLDKQAELQAYADKATAELKAELQQAREANRWIPVGERLPEIHDVVLIAVRNRSQAREGYLTEKNEWRVWGGVYPYFTAVTHWRPLPTPPEQEANG